MLKHLESTSEYSFDFTLFCRCVMPTLFKYRSNIDNEGDYHSFVGEIDFSRWAISLLRKYL